MWLTATACPWVTPLCSPLLTASTPCRTLTSPPEGGDQTWWEAVCLPHSASLSGLIVYLSVPCIRWLKKWLRNHCQGDVGTLWYHAIYHVHLHIKTNNYCLLCFTVPLYDTGSCVRAILSDLSHYDWMLEYEIISASTNVNRCLGVYLYLFSKCVYAVYLECINNGQ